MAELATPTVIEMGKIGLTGDIIPAEWYEKIRREDRIILNADKTVKQTIPGTVHLEAVVLLGRICYWYRPTIIRDEETGRVLRYERKFAADKLHLNYKQISAHFGITYDAAIAAVKTLTRLGLIEVELRNLTIKGVKYGNVMYPSPVVPAIYKLTHSTPISSPVIDTPSPSQEGEGGTLPQPARGPSPSQQGDPPLPGKGTYTENTTQTSTENLGAATPPPKPGKREDSEAVKARKASTLAAMNSGIERHNNLTGKIEQLFGINENWNTKTNVGILLKIKECPPEETIDRFAAWWYASYWKGVQKQPPSSLTEIWRVWPQAFGWLPPELPGENNGHKHEPDAERAAADLAIANARRAARTKV